MSIKVHWPWKMVGRFEDDEEITVGGFSEDDCMKQLIDRMDEHGELTWYSGVTDEDYAAGEYIGQENFVYD